MTPLMGGGGFSSNMGGGDFSSSMGGGDFSSSMGGGASFGGGDTGYFFN